jgi:hypothetical protein
MSDQDFRLLEPLIDLRPNPVSSMVRGLEATLAPRTQAYVGELLAPLRGQADISPAREALIANDPYFIGASYSRLRFDRDEIVANLEALMAMPGEALMQWDGAGVAPIVISGGHEAERVTYAKSYPASSALVRRVRDAFAAIMDGPAYAAIVAGGTRRLALAPNCVGSSSISSLPGYSMVGVGEEARFDNPQVNGLIHEAVHGIMFLAECATGRQLVFETGRTPIVSPWSGNALDPYQFVQALVVWHVLLAYWDEADPDSDERRRAAKGFRNAQGDRGAQRVLDAIEENVDPAFLAILRACDEASAARA